MSKLLRRLDGPSVSYPLGTALWPYVRVHAENTPAAIACTYGDRRLSYRDLCGYAEHLAAHLTEAGVKAGQVVAVKLPRSDVMLVALLALTRLQAPYLAVDDRWPESRCDEAIKVADSAFLLTGKLLSDVALSLNAITIRRLSGEIQSSYPNSCCIYFTSGSTGRPKAAAAPATGILRIAFDPVMNLSASTRMLQLAPAPWDAFALECWCPLIHGGTTVIHPDPWPSIESVRSLLGHYQVNAMFLTTALFNVFVDECIELFTTLNVVMCGGERVSRSHILHFIKLHSDVTLLHVYGPVESSIFATVYRVRGTEISDIPIGRPVANTSVLLVADEGDDHGGGGRIGEIVLAGDGLACGYINDPEETSLSFVTSGFARHIGERLYRTGDLAQFDADDNLIFMGRRDKQLKISGMRVEPEEVRQFLHRIEGVRASVVVGVPVDSDPKLGTVLFYSLRPGWDLAPDMIRHSIAAHFPAAFVPLAIVRVDDMPLTESGKVSARAFEALLAQLRIAPVATDSLWEPAVLERELAGLIRGPNNTHGGTSP